MFSNPKRRASEIFPTTGRSLIENSLSLRLRQINSILAKLASPRASPNTGGRYPFNQRDAASALSSGRVLNAMNAPGAALCTALITASNSSKLFGGRRMPPPITTPS